MFFSKFFKKDYRQFCEQGERFMQEGRYAEARYAFAEALDRIDIATDVGGIDAVKLQKNISAVNDYLANLNLIEAEHSINSGDIAKAAEHLHLVIELAEDVAVREKADKLLENLTPSNHSKNLIDNNVGCSGCNPRSEDISENSHCYDEQLSMEDRFDLLISTLPSPLPASYAALGEKFAYSYVLIHDGEDTKALHILEELLKENEQDIFLYEIAMIHYRRGDIQTTERLLHQAISFNTSNALCYLGLVQLLFDTDRVGEAISVLEHMLNYELLPDQAQVLLGDAYVVLGDDAKAIDNLSKALTFPAVARGAAERLVSLLDRHGRGEEAAYISKRYLKACC